MSFWGGFQKRAVSTKFILEGMQRGLISRIQKKNLAPNKIKQLSSKIMDRTSGIANKVPLEDKAKASFLGSKTEKYRDLPKSVRHYYRDSTREISKIVPKPKATK